MMKRTILVVLSAAVMGFAPPRIMAQSALNVDAQAARGFAAPSNNQAANFLIVVTNPLTGAAVTNLAQTDFEIINHFGIPGQVCGFSNNIVFFHNVGTGAYHIQVKLHHTNPSVVCAWVRGDYLAQVSVSSAQRLGQATVKLSIR
jgi:hypothetical protein